MLFRSSKYPTPHLHEFDLNDFVEGTVILKDRTQKAFFHNDMMEKMDNSVIHTIPKVIYSYVCRDCLQFLEFPGAFLLEKTQNDLNYLDEFTAYTLSKKLRSESNIECKCGSRNLNFQNLALKIPGQELIPFLNLESFHSEDKDNNHLIFEVEKDGNMFNAHYDFSSNFEGNILKLLFDKVQEEIRIIDTQNPMLSKTEGLLCCILNFKFSEVSSESIREDFSSTLRIESLSHFGFNLIETLAVLKQVEKSLNEIDTKGPISETMRGHYKDDFLQNPDYIINMN